MGFEPRMVMFKSNVRLMAAKCVRLTWEGCGTCLNFACCTLIFALQMRTGGGEARKNLTQGSRKVSVGQITLMVTEKPFVLGILQVPLHSLMLLVRNEISSLSPQSVTLLTELCQFLINFIVRNSKTVSCKLSSSVNL